MELKSSVSPKKYFGRKAVKLIDVKTNDLVVFNSVSSLVNYIKLLTNKGTSPGGTPLGPLWGPRGGSISTINKYAESEGVFRNKWLIKYTESTNSASSINANLNKDINVSMTVSENPSSTEKDKLHTENKSTYKVNISVEITDITNNTKLTFKSLIEAVKHIKSETGKGTPEGLKYALDRGTAYLNIYLVNEIKESLKLMDLKTNSIKYFSTLREVAN